MVNDSTGWVRVRQYYKTVKARDPISNLPVDYDIPIDWDIGYVEAEEGQIFVIGSPYQLFSLDIYSTPINDSRVLISREKLELSTLERASARPVPSDNGNPVHFKWPGI